MNKPVSEKYYKKLTERVAQIIGSLRHFESHAQYVMRFIDRYLENGSIPEYGWSEPHIVVIFHALLPEINAAIERSAACRRRAAERRARKEAEKQALATEKEGTEVSDMPEISDKEQITDTTEMAADIYTKMDSRNNTSDNTPKDEKTDTFVLKHPLRASSSLPFSTAGG